MCALDRMRIQGGGAAGTVGSVLQDRRPMLGGLAVCPARCGLARGLRGPVAHRLGIARTGGMQGQARRGAGCRIARLQRLQHQTMQAHRTRRCHRLQHRLSCHLVTEDIERRRRHTTGRWPGSLRWPSFLRLSAPATARVRLEARRRRRRRARRASRAAGAACGQVPHRRRWSAANQEPCPRPAPRSRRTGCHRSADGARPRRCRGRSHSAWTAAGDSGAGVRRSTPAVARSPSTAAQRMGGHDFVAAQTGHDQRACMRDPTGRISQQVQRGVVGPVKVFEDDHRRLLCQCVDEGDEQPMPIGAFGKPLRKQATGLRCDLVERAERPRRVHRVTRAPQATHSGRQRRCESAQHARLADAGLALDEDQRDPIRRGHALACACSCARRPSRSSRIIAGSPCGHTASAPPLMAAVCGKHASSEAALQSCSRNDHTADRPGPCRRSDRPVALRWRPLRARRACRLGIARPGPARAPAGPDERLHPTPGGPCAAHSQQSAPAAHVALVGCRALPVVGCHATGLADHSPRKRRTARVPTLRPISVPASVEKR